MVAEDDPKSAESGAGTARPSDVDISRVLSHALRHEPWVYELELDAEGWTSVQQLLAALREKGGGWTLVDAAAVEHVLVTSSKRRHEMRGDRIRALYGHSVPGRIAAGPGTPPARLFHGTSPEVAEIVREEGLLPMGRQYVHLSVDTDMALMVGRRKAGRPVLLGVDTSAAIGSGSHFFHGNEVVWLADSVPPHCVDRVQDPESDPGPDRS